MGLSAPALLWTQSHMSPRPQQARAQPTVTMGNPSETRAWALAPSQAPHPPRHKEGQLLSSGKGLDHPDRV